MSPRASGISLDDLKGIRQRVRLRKPQRVTLHSRAFAQLADFIVYKARRAGVPVVFVDPAYTSQQCCECGHIDSDNRVSQSVFLCRNCGVVAHADRNASRNIARTRLCHPIEVPERRSPPSGQPGATSKPGPLGPDKVDYRTSLRSNGGYTEDGSPSTVVPANCSIARNAPCIGAG
ncbi:RNA-guided endonuclease TnpB family protein [Actinoallomurus sp. CA-142502]|uniref:RNA-guided endonuclease TnpB family protein n=1 Tax=Actinoallomurus sp. CA-142502 TaxID=3239885 RepID=UPI003D8A8A45